MPECADPDRPDKSRISENERKSAFWFGAGPFATANQGTIAAPFLAGTPTFKQWSQIGPG